MNTMECGVRFGLAILLGSLFFACNVLDDFGDPVVSLDRTIVADMFGNHDGVATAQELTDLNEYFASNPEGWCITHCPAEYLSEMEIQAKVVREQVLNMHCHPYPSEQALRSANVGVNIKTPRITISVLRGGTQIVLWRLYRSPGPHFAEVAWELMAVIP
jgi:hypothetical protein